MSFTPQRAVEIVAGTPPGGGLDRSARALLEAINASRLLDVPASVVNIGGEGGRRAWRAIRERGHDPHVIGISSPNAIADRLMGVTQEDPDEFSPIAILYTEYIAFVVRADSPLRGGAHLVHRLTQDAASVTVALSTSLGNSNHVAVAIVVREAGADTRAPTIRVFDSALDAVADVVAGHADVGAITAASAVTELEAGTLSAIAVSAPARLPGIYAATPTWREQSIDCIVGSWRGVSGPPGLHAHQVAFWERVLTAAVATPQWKARMVRHFWTGMLLTGDTLSRHLHGERREMETVLGTLGLLSPR